MSHVPTPLFGDLAAEALEGVRSIFAGPETALPIVAEQDLPVLVGIAPRTEGSGIGVCYPCEQCQGPSGAVTWVDSPLQL
jgi:hypothetical protein